MAPSTLVVDTNFLISNLDLVEQLVEIHAEFSHVVVIPGTVLEELDGLKSGTKQTSRKAREVIHYIHKKLAETNPGIRGQRLSEFVQSNLKGDDSILDCCRFFSARSFTVLCSNDRNLCAKALTNEIKTVSFVQGMTATLIAVHVAVAAGLMTPEIGEQFLSREPAFNKPSTHESHDPPPDGDLDMADISESAQQPETMPKPLELPQDEYSSISSMERDVIKTLFESIIALIEYAMHQAYSKEELVYFQYKKPEPTGKSIAQVFDKFQIAVFSEYFPRRVYTEIQEAIKQPTSNFNKAGFDKFIDLWGGVMLHLSKNDPSYRNALNSLKAVVDRFYM
ncbi:Transcriptional protein SWT1 [Wickerhamiella sorbophila]|uniref:Transcriptional protein SWT1 n=1 Tax=Wickerhamiella sorbophila TaxID=45607 RepID=A0A2T0FKL0_9ASCO|nr:Transcriptional protein SWT1 [Wickerhamiella sorbophila]PRT55526.1 Transcriptional protein SWT1 [Wickerhamiella sorbophila]